MKIMKIGLYNNILALKYLINVSIFLMTMKLKFINLNIDLCKYKIYELFLYNFYSLNI